MVLHEKSFELRKPEARLAHSMIVFDPRHALVPWAFFQHGALLGMGAPNGSRRRNIHYHAVGANTCASVHMLNKFISRPVEEGGSRHAARTPSCEK